MPDRSLDEDFVLALEQEAGLPAELLSQVLELESDFPDLDARGARKSLQRALAQILDNAADRIEQA